MKLLTLLSPLLLSACVIPVPAQSAPSVPQQVYGKWQITQINKQSVDKATLVLNSSDSSFSAQTDCNNLFGEYTLSTDKKLHFKDVASSLKACPDMRVEQLLADTLPKVDSYRFNKRCIEMLDKQGRILLQGQRLSSQ